MGWKNRKARVAEAAHKGDLLGGGEAGEVEPVGEAAVLVVVALLLDFAEGCPAQAMHLDDHLKIGSGSNLFDRPKTRYRLPVSPLYRRGQQRRRIPSRLQSVSQRLVEHRASKEY